MASWPDSLCFCGHTRATHQTEIDGRFWFCSLCACEVFDHDHRPVELLGIADLVDAGRAGEHRGAFRALAEIGLAIAGGAVLRFAEERAHGRHSEGFLRRKGGSCDACTEAGIIGAVMRRQLLGDAP